MEPEVGLLGLLLVLVTVALGYVVKAGRLSSIDTAADRALGDRGVWLAVVLTRSGYTKWLTLLFVAVGVAALGTRRYLPEFFLLLTAQLSSQGAVYGLKLWFARLRPENWLVRRELGSSFPSGHATTAAVSYGGLLTFAFLDPFPQPARVVAAAVLAPWIVGIGWSRIVLRAHHVTDVIGGYLFGLACLCALLAVLWR